jgi:hypothetical protein
VIAGLVIYSVFLCATPFEHHDLSCELKTPQHCVACTSTIVSANLDVPIAPSVFMLADAGCTTSFDVRAESLRLAVRTSGRSPPSSS